MNASTRHPRGVRRRLGGYAACGLALTVAGQLSAGPALATTSPPPMTGGRPTPAATVDPASSVGGPRLASTGITTDLPPGTPAPPVMHDVAWLVADLDTGEVIAAKAPHARLAPASTLKTLASLVLLPRIDPKKSYAAAESDTRAAGTRIGLVPGQLYTGAQLFQAMLMGSANDAVYMLSRLNGGIPATLAEMNAEAKDLGALDTHAGNPSGLDAPGQSSSAYDLALFGRAAMQVQAFRAYDTTLTVPFPGNPAPKATPTTGAGAASGHVAVGSTAGATSASPVIVDAAGVRRQTYALSNHNTLLFNYPGTIGGKDGFTDQAHRTFISVARRNGHTYIATEMGGTDYQQWRPTARLLDWAFANGPKAGPVGRLVEPGEVAAAAAASASASAAASSASSASASSASAANAASAAEAALAADRSASGGPAAAALGLSSGTGGTTLAMVAGGLAAAASLGALGIRRAGRRRRSGARH